MLQFNYSIQTNYSTLYRKKVFFNINNFKIRTSYGIVGNSEIGSYPSIGTYDSSTYAGAPTLGYSQTANPNLKWETSSKFDFGINFTLLNNRILVEMDYYKKAFREGFSLNSF